MIFRYYENWFGRNFFIPVGVLASTIIAAWLLPGLWTTTLIIGALSLVIFWHVASATWFF